MQFTGCSIQIVLTRGGAGAESTQRAQLILGEMQPLMFDIDELLLGPQIRLGRGQILPKHFLLPGTPFGVGARTGMVRRVVGLMVGYGVEGAVVRGGRCRGSG